MLRIHDLFAKRPYHSSMIWLNVQTDHATFTARLGLIRLRIRPVCKLSRLRSMISLQTEVYATYTVCLQTDICSMKVSLQTGQYT